MMVMGIDARNDLALKDEFQISKKTEYQKVADEKQPRAKSFIAKKGYVF